MTSTIAARRVLPDAPMTHRQILESMTGLLAALFTALLSIPLLGQTPQLYHGLAFALIVGGIMVSSRRA